MRLENAVAGDVLERILSAYGFTMQKELSDKLGIAKSNVASWLQRGQVPGNVLVQCALDTGVDISWLVTGGVSNANKNTAKDILPVNRDRLVGSTLIKTILSSGGKPVLERILQAYGLNTQKQLSEYLEISTGTISTWVRRGFFPGDVVIACALETGVSLEWLATGVNKSHENETEHYITNSSVMTVPKYILKSGQLYKEGFCDVDNIFLNDTKRDENIFILHRTTGFYFIRSFESIISNGNWLLDIDGVFDVYQVSRKPRGFLKLKGEHGEFECLSTDIKPKGKVIAEFKRG